MSEELKCPICGKPTVIYMGNARKDRLCKGHAQQAKAGEIIQCAKCKKWHNKDIKCDCEETKEQNINRNTQEIFNILKIEEQKEESSSQKDTYKNEEIKCLICGEPSNGMHFCKKCYYKYRNKVLILKINKCIESEILDDSYESINTCNDGHKVKSKSEVLIDNYLFERKIPHAYEQELPISATESIYPDFCLPGETEEDNIYIEHWGYDETNKKYTESKNYKIEIYKKIGVTVICTTEKDMKNVKGALDKKLKFYKKGKVNFIDE